jgi:TonB family protein
MTLVADLQRASFSLEWHEAVALIAELADTMRASPLAFVPAPESIVITADGTLVVDGGPTFEGVPSQDLAGLLERLLSSGSCPPELQQFVASNLAEPPAQATLEEFAEALAFFERPGRRELLQAIGVRAADVDAHARADEELARLAARARDQQDEAAVQPQDKAKRSHRGLVLLAAAAVAVFLPAGAFVLLKNSQSTPSTLAGRVRTQVKEIVQTGLEAVGVEREEPPSLPAQTLPEAPAPRAKRRPSQRSTPPADLTVRVNEPGGVPEAPTTRSEEPDLPEPPIESDSTVYNADAAGVEPPVLVRPHMPSRPSLAAHSGQPGVLELVVNEAGAVDHVRLISPDNRYHDRMIVAAAKTWQFRPATKDGLPVRSRMRIRVTL